MAVLALDLCNAGGYILYGPSLFPAASFFLFKRRVAFAFCRARVGMRRKRRSPVSATMEDKFAKDDNERAFRCTQSLVVVRPAIDLSSPRRKREPTIDRENIIGPGSL